MADGKMIPVPPLAERGRGENGDAVELDRRLWMQLLVFRSAALKEDAVKRHLDESGLECVLYRDVSHPYGFGVLGWNEDTEFFTSTFRTILTTGPFEGVLPEPAFTMFGRSYALGHERDLEETLLKRPRERACSYPYAVWYPLRRRGAFELISDGERREALMEHAHLGIAFGKQGYGVDIRLSCYGVDTNDNDFLIGLVGPSLHSLSVIVATMRKTQHTAEFIERLGPFFIGKVAYERSGV